MSFFENLHDTWDHNGGVILAAIATVAVIGMFSCTVSSTVHNIRAYRSSDIDNRLAAIEEVSESEESSTEMSLEERVTALENAMDKDSEEGSLEDRISALEAKVYN